MEQSACMPSVEDDVHAFFFPLGCNRARDSPYDTYWIGLIRPFEALWIKVKKEPVTAGQISQSQRPLEHFLQTIVRIREYYNFKGYFFFPYKKGLIFLLSAGKERMLVQK